MHGRFRRVHDDFWVAPQLLPEDFAEVVRLGIRTVINNRPDGETPGQPTDAELRAAARAAGLAYVAVPAPSGMIFPDHVAAMAAAIASTRGPWLAFCRSGTRSCRLWALVAARHLAPARIISQALAAGYDLASLWPMLEAIHMAQDEIAAAS